MTPSLRTLSGDHGSNPDVADLETYRAARGQEPVKASNHSGEAPSLPFQRPETIVLGSSGGAPFISKGAITSQHEFDDMSLSREEFNARLGQSKAEVEAVAASMKTELATWREQMRSDLKDVKTSVDRQTDKLEHNFTSQQVKLDAAVQIQTAKLEKTISDTRVDIIRWVLGIPAIIFTLWKIYEAIPK